MLSGEPFVHAQCSICNVHLQYSIEYFIKVCINIFIKLQFHKNVNLFQIFFNLLKIFL